MFRQAEELSSDHELIVAGGWQNPETTMSSNTGTMGHLKSSHEEADARIALHAADAATHAIKRVVV